jgi:hypothetical protein
MRCYDMPRRMLCVSQWPFSFAGLDYCGTNKYIDIFVSETYRLQIRLSVVLSSALDRAFCFSCLVFVHVRLHQKKCMLM